MDLGTIEQNIKEHRYTSIASFREDINQVSRVATIFGYLGRFLFNCWLVVFF